ncbi:hypothetical protein G2W53_031786 [Senna tora]|uniref:Uncharacterized protein n=1 Tax=Senna tora TaxID=362788 RepID=A0A834SXM9_9FABA|nr:hypothetical protein G2W53_031786 [Senna tora]
MFETATLESGDEDRKKLKMKRVELTLPAFGFFNGTPCQQGSSSLDAGRRRSAKEVSPVDFVYARSSIIHQNPESTGATLPIALSPKSAIRVSYFLIGSWNTLKLAGITPSPRWNLSIFFSHD